MPTVWLFDPLHFYPNSQRMSWTQWEANALRYPLVCRHGGKAGYNWEIKAIRIVEYESRRLGSSGVQVSKLVPMASLAAVLATEDDTQRVSEHLAGAEDTSAYTAGNTINSVISSDKCFTNECLSQRSKVLLNQEQRRVMSKFISHTFICQSQSFNASEMMFLN